MRHSGKVKPNGPSLYHRTKTRAGTLNYKLLSRIISSIINAVIIFTAMFVFVSRFVNVFQNDYYCPAAPRRPLYLYVQGTSLSSSLSKQMLVFLSVCLTVSVYIYSPASPSLSLCRLSFLSLLTPYFSLSYVLAINICRCVLLKKLLS